MPAITTQTLQIAIRAVEDRIRLLEPRLAAEIAAGDDDAADTHLELVDHHNAAGDLEDAYDAELRGGVINLVPYDELVARDE